MPLIDPIYLHKLLGPATGRFDVDSLEHCESTNTELLRRANAGAPSGAVLVADRQSAGRGRRGRQWLSTPEASLTFSVLWRFDGQAAGLAGLSLAVGLAMAHAMESLGVANVGLKWPNDVLLNDGKLAGILVELTTDRRGTLAVIGIGLNLARPTEQQLASATASLLDALKDPPERHQVLSQILVALAQVLDRFALGGFAALQTQWQERHAWQARAVRVLLDHGQDVGGICRGADADGALLIETAEGLQRFLSGDVTLRRAALHEEN